MSRDQEQNLLPPPTEVPESESETPGNDGKTAKILRGIASAIGSTGVAMGAFGAHALKETLSKKGTASLWQTATIYQLFHAAAILSLAASSSSTLLSEQQKGKHLLAGKLMGTGNLLFSGSIYFLALDVGPKYILGPITPIGGLLMIGGWVVVGLA